LQTTITTTGAKPHVYVKAGSFKKCVHKLLNNWSYAPFYTASPRLLHSPNVFVQIGYKIKDGELYSSKLF
jgi:hypothetical protein